jgi:hypothetical protein
VPLPLYLLPPPSLSLAQATPPRGRIRGCCAFVINFRPQTNLRISEGSSGMKTTKLPYFIGTSRRFIFRSENSARSLAGRRVVTVPFWHVLIGDTVASLNLCVAVETRKNVSPNEHVDEHSEQTRAPRINGPRDVPRCGALSLLQKPLHYRGFI